MCEFDPVVHHISILEKVDYIVPERVREACAMRMMDYKCAAIICGVTEWDFGAMANGHKPIPNDMIFGLMKAFNFPRDFFHYIKWRRV